VWSQSTVVPGAKVAVTSDGVQFGMRDQPMLALQAGTEIRVTEVRGQWIGGYLLTDGPKQLGWVRSSEVRPDAARDVPAQRPPAESAVDPATPDDAKAVAFWRERNVTLRTDDRGHVQQLVAEGTQLNDDDLEHLAGLPHLRVLDLGGQPISDAGVSAIAACRSLRNLYLAGTKITDQGFAQLGQLSQLEVLSVAKSGVTGKGLQAIGPLERLSVLSMGSCAVRDDDLRQLVKFPGLEVLALPQSEITDAGLEHVGQVVRLRVLNLDGTAVTGSGFRHLYDLTELRMLYVRECPVETEHINRLDDHVSGLAIYE
jgi:hypothetical protein